MSSKIIHRFIVTEKALKLAEFENKLTLIVDINSDKKEIKKAIENLYNVKVEKVNVLITPRYEKKAIVKLSKEFSALELYSKLGLI
jgi:large subunit ribosomal protein L23